MRLPERLTVRARLALLLTALVVLTGAVLLTVSYLLVNLGVHDTMTRDGGPFAIASRSVVMRANLFSGLLVRYGIVLALLVGIAGGLAWLVAGRVLRPLRQITDAARRITSEDLHERLALAGPADELTELGNTFDAMLARLEAAFNDQRLFAANAAHELRTPLTVMRAELDLLLTEPQPSPAEVRDAAARLLGTVLSSGRMLERLLTLTRGMLAPGEAEPVPLGQVVRQALSAAADTARSMSLTVRAGLGEARAYGDRSLIGDLVGNLVDNAVKYNYPGGWISVDTLTAADRAVLEIANSGPRIFDADLNRLLEPFRRADRQRTGNSSGLGLSIVRTVVAAHGGELGLQAIPDGGLRIRVSLPGAPAGPGA